MTTRVLYDIAAAAEALSTSEATVRRAIKATDPAVFPPPMRAKWSGNKLAVEHDELKRWARSLRDA